MAVQYAAHKKLATEFLTLGIEQNGQTRIERAAAYFAYLTAAGFKGKINVENAGYVEGPGAKHAVDWVHEVIFTMPRTSVEAKIKHLVDALEARRQ